MKEKAAVFVPFFFFLQESAYTTTPEPQIDKKNCFKS
jgi:hypothetical protein